MAHTVAALRGEPAGLDHQAGFLPAAMGAERWGRELLRLQEDVTAAGGDLDAVMNAVVAAALRLLPGCNGAVVELRDDDTLVYRAAAGTSADAVGKRLALATSLTGRAVRTGQAQLCLDAESDPRVDRVACRAVGLRSMVVVPIAVGGAFVGALKIHSDKPYALGQSDLLTAQLLANPIAMGLAHAAQKTADDRNTVLARRFEATFEQAAVGIAHVAPDGTFLRVNDRFCAIAGHGRTALLAGGFQQITHPEDLTADLDNLQALVAGEIPHYAMEKRYIRADGEIVWINLTVSIVRASDGQTDFFVGVIEDIGRRKAAETAATQDPLTGLPNRRLATEFLRLSVKAHRRLSQPLTLAYLDLDGFKAINDRHGHAEGDRCLVAVAEAVRGALREQDVVGRLGGDEFMIVLPGASSDAAHPVLTRVRDAIINAGEEAGWALGVSIGAVCVEPTAATDAEALIAGADRLMYRAKHGHKGTIVLEELI